MKKDKNQTLPEFYEVDDIPVKIMTNPKTGDYFALNDLGNPYDITVAMNEGQPITEAQFKKLAEARKIELA